MGALEQLGAHGPATACVCGCEIVDGSDTSRLGEFAEDEDVHRVNAGESGYELAAIRR